MSVQREDETQEKMGKRERESTCETDGGGWNEIESNQGREEEQKEEEEAERSSHQSKAALA